MDGSRAINEFPVVLRFEGLYPHQLAGYEAHRMRRDGDLRHVDASRSQPIGAFRSRLEAAGKPTKAAITAPARKLLGVLYAMLATGTDCSRDAPVWIQLPANPARSDRRCEAFRTARIQVLRRIRIR